MFAMPWQPRANAEARSNAAGTLVDLAGQFGNVEYGATGQILETSMQGIYVPTYMMEQNPGLKSVSDLAKFKDLIKDPEDPSKGVVVNCIIGWSCQKIIRAKWHAYGLGDDLNLLEPGAAAAIDANIVGAYQAGEPTKLVADLDLTLLEEPPWTQECQDAIDAAIEAEPHMNQPSVALSRPPTCTPASIPGW